jgi:hypothetical protein
VQIAQQLTLGEKPYWLKFSIDMLQYINMGLIFLPSILLCDEVTRHITCNHNEGLHIHIQHSNLHLLLRKHPSNLHLQLQWHVLDKVAKTHNEMFLFLMAQIVFCYLLRFSHSDSLNWGSLTWTFCTLNVEVTHRTFISD